MDTKKIIKIITHALEKNGYAVAGHNEFNELPENEIVIAGEIEDEFVFNVNVLKVKL